MSDTQNYHDYKIGDELIVNNNGITKFRKGDRVKVVGFNGPCWVVLENEPHQFGGYHYNHFYRSPEFIINRVLIKYQDEV